mmetsp:Transcript_123317/g.262953  ORF Transcript_123317/g.262953 Transcript_123317/m.262953 type:complete len:98 (-) Transcript_123317:78-371(-)
MQQATYISKQCAPSKKVILYQCPTWMTCGPHLLLCAKKSFCSRKIFFANARGALLQMTAECSHAQNDVDRLQNWYRRVQLRLRIGLAAFVVTSVSLT